MIPTHITLVPPTEVDDEQLEQDRAPPRQAAADESRAFRVHLRGTGTFRPVSPVVFVTLVEGISQCEQLARRRTPRAARRRPGRSPTTRTSPSPTTSATTQLDRAFDELADFECEFDVEEFHLYVHDDGPGWRPTRDFALLAGVPEPHGVARRSA